MEALKKICLISTLVIAFAACQKQERFVDHISAASIADSNLPPQKKAEALGASSEKLLAAGGYTQALDTANLALQFNPQDLKANLLKLMLTPIAMQRGIINRILPLVQQEPTLKESYAKKVAELRTKLPTKLFQLLTVNSEAEIRSEEDLQSHLDRTHQALDELRLFIKERKNEELVVKGSTVFVTNLVERYADACEIKESARYVYELVCPGRQSKFNVTLNRADFEYLQGMISFFEVYISIVNAYDGSGVVKVGGAHLDGKASAQQVADELLKNSQFGHLRSSQRLNEIKALGLDLVAGIDWATTRQPELCPNSWSDPRNRVGKFLNVGFCVWPGMNSSVRKAENILNGKDTEAVARSDKEIYKTEHAVMKFLEKPLADIRSLGAIKFNSCNRPHHVDDPTLGGIFPRGDANKFLETANSQCR